MRLLTKSRCDRLPNKYIASDRSTAFIILNSLIKLLESDDYVPVILVWIGHNRALRARENSFKSYWRDAWVKINFARERMKPERYQR
ncbi:MULTISPECIES: hypothetical protein [unclassified Nostoc]|uniref:hypothetical protein n=1 Tax=unclassified Nostoc TaxID=2593658 RepID=UPI000B95582E|nr:hypothetical protein [Nostoc sp. 'Peltigera membranacea cyanobiont' 210A]OYD92005.1 hypothetical protein CDG76_25545 [Nostoc sp. 'Peltigera membranacea cyanobiont' 210A]